MAVTRYAHGVSWRDVPTSIVAPVTADSGIPFAVGANPVHQVSGPIYVNVPRVYLNYEQAVMEMGYSDDWRSYPLSQVIYVYFALFNTGPIILSNVLDPSNSTFQGAAVADQSVTFNNGLLPNISDVIIPSSIELETMDAPPVALVEGTDWVGAWGDDNGVLKYSISAIPDGAIATTGAYGATISYNTVNPAGVNRTHILGGIDPTTGRARGLEVVENVFPIHGIVPGVLLAPDYSQDPEVAAVLAAKVSDINGCFRSTTNVDIDSTGAPGVVGSIDRYSNVYAWKNTNNYTDPRQAVCWPRVGLQTRDMWLSVQLGARMEKTDNDNGNIPVETPSNKLLKMNRTLVGPLGDPSEVTFSKDVGNYLNGQGLITAINWIGGWKAWGSNMACYPAITDPKDRWMPARRMTDFVGNSLVLTIFQFVDRPTNRRLIEQIVDTVNVWLNSLVSSGNALGARVEFRHDENPDTEMIDGHYVFHVFQFFPLPAEWIEFLLELDVSYLGVIFG